VWFAMAHSVGLGIELELAVGLTRFDGQIDYAA